MTLPQTLIAELEKLDDAQIFELLGHIVDPGKDSPFTISPYLQDCLMDMSDSYGIARYEYLADSTNDTWTQTSDQVYDDLRADEAGVYAK